MSNTYPIRPSNQQERGGKVRKLLTVAVLAGTAILSACTTPETQPNPPTNNSQPTPSPDACDTIKSTPALSEPYTTEQALLDEVNKSPDRNLLWNGGAILGRDIKVYAEPQKSSKALDLGSNIIQTPRIVRLQNEELWLGVSSPVVGRATDPGLNFWVSAADLEENSKDGSSQYLVYEGFNPDTPHLCIPTHMKAAVDPEGGITPINPDQSSDQTQIATMGPVKDADAALRFMDQFGLVTSPSHRPN